MKKITFLLLTLCIAFSSCNTDESTQEEEAARLDKMYNEVIAYSQKNSKACTDPNDWSFVKFSGFCSEYIIYHKSVDVTVLQRKIDKYVTAKGNFDAKWGILYDCMVTPAPIGIKCSNDKPILSFDSVPY